ncbi:MAG: hypothetical protein HY231_27325 [Acidobacteria bacterium]|nr:hypothetical protein [Acidobacteriota bacterium]
MNQSETLTQDHRNPSEPAHGTTAKSAFHTLQQTVSRTLHEAAHSLQEKAGDRSGKNQQWAGYGQQAAAWLQRSADYIEDLQPQQLKSDLAKQVRANPGRSLLIASAAGLVIGTLIRRR